MARHRLQLVLLLLVIAGAAYAGDARLEIVDRATDSGEIMLRLDLEPDIPGLEADDFALRLNPTDGDSKPVAFLVARYRDAYYFDIRRLPVLPAGEYTLAVELADRPDVAVATDPFEYRPPLVDVALVIDQSFSMRWTDPNRLRLAAAERFIELAAAGEHIGHVTVVAFDAGSETLIPLTPPSETEKFRKAIDQIPARGFTNMDRALEQAAKELERGSGAAAAVLLLTDGENDPDPYENTHRAYRDRWPVYTIGLSDEADADTLKTIARETGGEFYDAPTSEQLREVFSRIYYAIERRSTIRKDHVDLAPDQRERLAVPIDDTVLHAVFSARAEHDEFDLELQPPQPAEPEARSAVGLARYAAYRRPEVGLWRAAVKAGRLETPVTFEADATTDLFPVLFPLEEKYSYGRPVHVVCSLARVDRPIDGAAVTATIAVGGRRYEQELENAGRGIYEGTFAFDGEKPHGSFRLEISAAGETEKGNAFRRLLTAEGHIEPRREPDIRTDPEHVRLGPLYNTETGRAEVGVRTLLPPDTKLDLRARFESDALPPDAVDLELASPDDEGRQKLAMAVTVPAGLEAGEYRGQLTLAQDQTEHAVPVTVEIANPRLVVEPDEIDFGRVLPDGTGQGRLRVRVEPRGAADVALELSGDVADLATLDGTTLRAGTDAEDIALELAVPADAAIGERTGAVALDCGFRRQSVPVSVQVVRPELTASPSVLDFGEIEPGGTESLPLELTVSSPVEIDASFRVRWDDDSAADLLDVHGKERTLTPDRPVTVDAALGVPHARSPGPLRGTVRIAARGREIGSVPVRARVAPIHTFAVEPESADLGPVAMTTEQTATVTVRSTVPVPQTIRVEPGDGSPLVSIEPGRLELEPEGEAVLTVSVRPSLDAQPGAIHREFRLSGPMLGRSVTAAAEVVPPPDGGFRVDQLVRVGPVPPGEKAGAGLTVTSTIAEPQDIVIKPDRSLDRPAWVDVPERRVRLEPDQSVTVDLRCTVFSGAESGLHRQPLTVRGPLSEEAVTVAVDVRAPAPPRPSNLPLVLLFSLALLLFAALVYLILRALFEMPIPRMAKYFATSAVLNAAFFVLLTQMFAVRQAVEEHQATIRVDETIRIASDPAAAYPTPTESPTDVDEAERRIEDEQQRTPDGEEAHQAARAVEDEPTPQMASEARHEVPASQELERRHPELARMTDRRLQEVVDAAAEVERQTEESRAVEPTVVVADPTQAQPEPDEARSPEAVRELAEAARRLQAERTRRAPEVELAQPDTDTERTRTEMTEAVEPDVREVERRTEVARIEEPDGTVTADRQAPDRETDRRAAAEEAAEEPGDAQPSDGERRVVQPTAADRLVRHTAPPDRRPEAREAEQVPDHARPSERGRAPSQAVQAPETGVETPRATAEPGGPEGDRAAAGADHETPAPEVGLSRRDVSPATAAPDGPLAAAPAIDRPDAGRAAPSVEPAARAPDRAAVASPDAEPGASPGEMQVARAQPAAGPEGREAARPGVEPGEDAPAEAAAAGERRAVGVAGTETPTHQHAGPAGPERTRDVTPAVEGAARPVERAAGAPVAADQPGGQVESERAATGIGEGERGPTAGPEEAAPEVAVSRRDVSPTTAAPGGPLAAASAVERPDAGRAAPSVEPAARAPDRAAVASPDAEPGASPGEMQVARAQPAAGPEGREAARPGVEPGEDAPAEAAAAGERRAVGAASAEMPTHQHAGLAGPERTRDVTPAVEGAARPVERAAGAPVAADQPGGQVESERAATGIGEVERGPTAGPEEAAPEVAVSRRGVSPATAGPDGPLAAAPAVDRPDVGRAAPSVEPAARAPDRASVASPDAEPGASPGEMQVARAQPAAGPEGREAAMTDADAEPGDAVSPVRGDRVVEPGRLISHVGLSELAGPPARGPVAATGPTVDAALGTPSVSTEPEPTGRADPIQVTGSRRRAETAAADRPRPAASPVGPDDDETPSPTRQLERVLDRPTPVDLARERADRGPAAGPSARRGAIGTIEFPLVRYDGDWDCDKTAMPSLAFQLQRRAGVILHTSTKVIDITDERLHDQPFFFMTGHLDFQFSDEEIKALREYIAGGGSIWINDSTHEDDETYDRAVRRELKRLMPDHELTQIRPPDHPVFSTGYDLTEGFRGYTVPPGDKYRSDYLEGINVDGRTAILYTRNDYGDGLGIDPHTAPLMPSLTDLSPEDMLEGSSRMGINIALYFLRDRLGERNIREVSRTVREHTAREERRERTTIETAGYETFEDFTGEPDWDLEEWGDPAQVEIAEGPDDDGHLTARFEVGEERKVVVSRDLPEAADFSGYNAIVMDITSEMPAGARLAVGLNTMPGWEYAESPPAFIRPGENRNVVIRLDGSNFKTEASDWEFTEPAENLDAVRKIALLVYPIRDGAIRIHNIRLARFEKAAEEDR